MITGILQNADANWQKLFRSMQKEQGAMIPASAAEALVTQSVESVKPQPSSVHNTSSNMMSRNFASAEREESRYMKARKAGQEALSKQANRQNAILSAGMAELSSLEDEGNYAARNLIGKKAAQRMLEEKQQSVSEESEKNLKEIKDAIEKIVQEATAPKDANGDPIEEISSEGIVEAPPVLEIPDSNPAPAPAVELEVAAATPAVPTPDILLPVPTVHTIDIIV